MSNVYCSMIHGGLELNFKGPRATAHHCCLRNTRFPIDIKTNFWNDSRFIPLRDTNKQNTWAPGCENCQRLEESGHASMRQGMNDGLGIQGKTDLSGPARIDLMFDISCNLACRTCGAHSSTFWQKHLKDHNLWSQPIFSPRSYNKVISSLTQLDLSNLRQVVFCGGETLLGQSYWEIADWLADNVPNAKQQLFVSFQTNGTQPILDRNYKIIEKLQGVKLHISLDGTDKRFEYLRWPAIWNQTVDNILQIKQTAPSNVMFLIEETISIFNLWYTNELSDWVQQNFATNQEGDIVNHTKHLAIGNFSLEKCSQEYVNAMQQKINRNLIPSTWKESPDRIQTMISNIKQFDQIRSQSFVETFPEVAEFYRRFL